MEVSQVFDKKLKSLIKEKSDGTIISFSQYSKYFKCPKSWELTYIKKHKIPSESIDLVFGQSMHSVIQEWLRTIYTESVKKANLMDLNRMLLDNMKSEYILRKEKMGNHFCTPEELTSYYHDGIEILNYLKKKRSAYFTTKKVSLVAIEYPINMNIHKDYAVNLIGYLDLIFKEEYDNSYHIIDIKTSTRGWNDYKKKDQLLTDQLLLYKKYLVDELGMEVDKVNITYFILKRKIDVNSLYPQKRIQEFRPSSGKVSMNRISKQLNQFVTECFNPDGTYNIDRIYPPMAGYNMKNCMFCPFNDREDLCPKEKRICNE